MHLTSLTPPPDQFTTFSSTQGISSTISPSPESLSSLCLLWEQSHHNDNMPMPNICHQFTSPDKLLTGLVAPPGTYNFARLASDMFQGSSKSAQPVPVLPGDQGIGRKVGLAGVGLGVLTILLIVLFVTCLKRRKNIQTVLSHELRSTQVELTLDTLNKSRRKDIPPDYSSVVQMKKQEEEDLPSYHQAVASTTQGCLPDSISVHVISNLNNMDTSSDSDGVESRRIVIDSDSDVNSCLSVETISGEPSQCEAMC